MRRHWVDVAILFVLASGACLYVSLAVPSVRTVTVHSYLLFLGALLMLVVVSGVTAAAPRARRSDFAAALAERPEPAGRVSQLAKVEREVTLSIGNAHDLHFRLLPHLREIARRDSSAGAQRPGPDTLGRWWELLRPDRPSRQRPVRAGIALADLRELVADLENI